MARHRSASGNRRVSRGLILTVAAVFVVIAVVIGWLALRDHAGDADDRAAASCVNGDVTVPVAAAPSIAPVLTSLAESYSDVHPVVRDHCVTVRVHPADGSTALQEIAAPDGGPALWVPQSAADVAALRSASPERIDGNPVSLAASPVVLAAPQSAAATLQDLAWNALPARQSAGTLGLAMPAGGDAAPTGLTLAAAIADAGPDPTGTALTGKTVDGPRGQAATAALVGGAPGDRAAEPGDVLTALQQSTAPEGVRAVPTTAEELYRFNTDSGAAPLSAVRPAGPTPVVDYPAVLLRPAGGSAAPTRDGDRAVDAQALSAAASDFLNYLARPEQASRFVQSGFLVTGAPDAASPADTNGVLTGAPPAQVLPGPADDALAALGAAIGAPAAPATPAASSGGATTVLLDVSGSMGANEGAGTRLSNVTRALADRLGGLPDSDSVGLWTYSSGLSDSGPYRVIVPTGKLSDQVDGTQRRQSLVTGLDAARPRAATHTYRSLQAAYSSAVQGYVDGAVNSVLLITDGPNDDQSFKSTQALLDAIGQAADPARPVRIDIIVIGPNDDVDSLRSVATATGGTVTEVPSSADPGLGGAVDALLR
ncbi:substrate-binding domain-containing protein [Tomitella fengzijianii]|uniref:VWA domain-containing protein n=1 Tax=Tomitella fengzijianii TaxID=2597660 RepID=A0A516X2P3_9ACTN|nr:substrate-binding domain-containing protein [Tomitella fengzijianii]QDQ97323.1 VWA domain-containing protein [Tomitella fengzijianii]